MTLRGSVLRPWRPAELERRVAHLEGVRAIRNEIRVQPASSSDQRLRVELYRRNYGQGLLERYAARPDPPVRIVVENGSVTLTGVVESPVEKAALASIARETPSLPFDDQVLLGGRHSEMPG